VDDIPAYWHLWTTTEVFHTRLKFDAIQKAGGIDKPLEIRHVDAALSALLDEMIEKNRKGRLHLPTFIKNMTNAIGGGLLGVFLEQVVESVIQSREISLALGVLLIVGVTFLWQGR
jgi:selenophosphate synthase